jgi:aryl-alcohol dehydrogenase-like predicted oxidoreductase
MTLRPEPYHRFWNQETFEAIDRLEKAASDRGVSTAGLALAWVLSNPVVTSVIVGPRRVEHFRPVEEALALDLTEQERDEIGELFGSGPLGS